MGLGVEQQLGIAGAASEASEQEDQADRASVAGLGHDWTWRTDVEHRYLDISEGLRRCTGLDPKRFHGKSRLAMLLKTTADAARAAAHLDDLDARRPFRDFIQTLEDASGRRRLIAVSGKPRSDRTRGFEGYDGIARDVTDLMERLGGMEEVHQAVEDGAAERLKATLDVMNDAFCYYDAEDRLLHFNQAVLAMYPQIRDEFRLGARFLDIVDAGLAKGVWEMEDDDALGFRARIAAMRSEGGTSPVHFRLSDGRWIMHRETRTADGGTICICTDVSEIKRREWEAARAKDEAENLLEDLRRMLDSLQMGIVVLDADLNAEIINRAYYDIWRVTPAEVPPGSSVRALMEVSRRNGSYQIADEDWDAYAEARLQAIRAGEVPEQEFQLADGTTLIYSVAALSGGKRLVTYYDVTSLKAQEAELASASRQAGQFLHDLERTLDAMDMGIVLLDRELNAVIVNEAFYGMWGLNRETAPAGISFAAIMELNRHNGIYDVAEDKWDEFVRWRLEEIRGGRVEPREFARADGKTVIYAVTVLSDGKRLVTYFDVTGMKAREEALADALEKAKLAEEVLDSIPGPIFVKDEALRFVMANKAFARVFGRSPSELIGLKAADLVAPEEAAIFEASEREVLENGNLFENEEDFVDEAGEWTRIVRKNRVSTNSGARYVAATIFDMTELKRREREAHEARRQLANVLETLPAGVIIYDKDDRFVLANGKIQEALPAMVSAMSPGKSLREAVEVAHAAGYFRESGDPALDAIYDEDREAWIAGYLERYYERQRVFERRNPDGRWFKAFDTRLEDGTYVGVRVDISELKEREKALQESMAQIELFQHVLDELPVSTYVKSKDLAFEFVNKAWCAISGVSQEEALGKTDLDFFGEEGRGFFEHDRRVIAEGTTDETEETLTHRDGTRRHLIARKSRLVGKDGSIHLIGSSTDITELKQREAELQDARHKAVLADRAKSEFLANMSHEIRTPMNGVLGMAELLAKSSLDAKQKTFTDIIMKSGNALLTIINDILDFSKIDAGQLVLDPAPFNLAEAIEDVATLMSTRAKEKDLEMIVRYQPGIPENHIGDVGRIRQIVTNLMGNAVKFTESGHVLVEVSGESAGADTRLRLSVTDTGIGIPPDKLDLVFEKFSQVDGSSTRRHEGTGLGLAITSRLVELMGGEIGVESNVGEGSTFWFTVTLPRAEGFTPRRPAPVDVTGARVLVVDDNAVNRAILLEQMAAWGFDSCAAQDGPEGLKVLEAASRFGIEVDCVVLDYQMPGMTGIDVARRLRSSEGIKETPIVLLTSVDQSLSNRAHSGLAIDAQLTKPARASLLLETLVETIQKKRQRTLSIGRPRDPHGEQAPEQQPAAPPPVATVRPVFHQPAPASEQGLRRVDILVAEDNEVNQLVFTQILSETGLSFEIVGNGRLALEAWREMQPGMILMDVSMPEMNGHEATGRIREAEQDLGTHVPIVGVTAHALKGDRERCIDAGMDDYLSKPISPKALLAMIDKWLKPSEGESRLQAG